MKSFYVTVCYNEQKNTMKSTSGNLVWLFILMNKEISWTPQQVVISLWWYVVMNKKISRTPQEVVISVVVRCDEQRNTLYRNSWGQR